MSVYFFVKELGYHISDAIRIRQEEGCTSFIITKFLVLVEKLGFRWFDNLARNFPVGDCGWCRWNMKVRVFLIDRSNLDLTCYTLNLVIKAYTFCFILFLVKLGWELRI